MRTQMNEILFTLFIIQAVTIIVYSVQTEKDMNRQPVLHIHESSVRRVHNLTNLVYQYYLVCGSEYICDKQYYNFIKKIPTKINISLCPKCSCDKECIHNGDCCPDVMFSMPDPDCITTSIVHGGLNIETKSRIITNCHDKASEELKRKCGMNYTGDESLRYTPVTSMLHVHTFRNKFCAECNGVYNYSSWRIDISCRIFADFNFLSSYHEILELAKSKTCSLEYKADKFMPPICPDRIITPPDSKSESLCNVTGTWSKYDSDIENACLSDYLNPQGKYQNIFCSLCNPPALHQNIISNCNASGLWSPYDATLSDLCMNMDSTVSTSPYKNVFCFLCNRNNSHPNHYYDGTANIRNDEYNYGIKITSYNIEFYNFILEQKSRPEVLIGRNTNMTMLIGESKQLNKTKLILFHYTVYGKYQFCSNINVPITEQLLCSCEDTCIFRARQPYCCIDKILEYPTSCVSNTLSQSRKTITQKQSLFGARNKCKNGLLGKSSAAKARCEQPGDDIFSILPVNDEHIIYRNLDCFRCSQSIETNTFNFGLWQLDIKCELDINYRFHATLNDLIIYAKQEGCFIQIVPQPKYDELFQMGQFYCGSRGDPRLRKTCNMTGQWQVFDQDILSACETWGKFLPPYKNYKNVYCYLCNTKYTQSNLNVDSCLPREQQIYGQAMIDLCKLSPRVPGHEPYKNIFCKTCSTLNMTLPPVPYWRPSIFNKAWDNEDIGDSGHAESSISINHPMLRALFVSGDNFGVPVHAEIQILDVTLSNGEVYDRIYNKRRNLTCYPGKMIMRDQCQPLLKITSNLRYTMSFTLEGVTVLDFSVHILLSDIRQEFERILSEVLTEKVVFDSFYVMVNVTCDTEPSFEAIGLDIMLHTTFFLNRDLDRLFIEEQLVNMTKRDYIIGNSTFKPKFTTKAFMLPTLINTVNFIKQCFQVRVKETDFQMYNDFQTTIVSDLILCRQVSMDSNEFRLDKTTLELAITHSTEKLPQGKFLLIGDNARICLSDFERLFSKNESISSEQPIVTALNITTLICSVISLVCLFLTFLTYCLFRAMRSVPGMNNMSLVFSMFFALLLFQVGFQKSSFPVLCTVMGILIHFFWLSTFGCMNVCSFHMYSVFASNSLTRRLSDNWKKQTLLYLLYSYGLSAAVIIINVVIIASISKGQSIGYGTSRCFITNNASFYITFLAPVMIICISNIYFFIRTAIQIKSTPKVESTKERKNLYIVYVKLFSLTGITWIMLVIDTIFPITVFSFFVTVATACQGLFVFVSFIANRRVLTLYKGLFCGKKHRESTASQPKSSLSANTISTHANSSSF